MPCLETSRATMQTEVLQCFSSASPLLQCGAGARVLQCFTPSKGGSCSSSTTRKKHGGKKGCCSTPAEAPRASRNAVGCFRATPGDCRVRPLSRLFGSRDAYRAVRQQSFTTSEPKFSRSFSAEPFAESSTFYAGSGDNCASRTEHDDCARVITRICGDAR